MALTAKGAKNRTTKEIKKANQIKKYKTTTTTTKKQSKFAPNKFWRTKGKVIKFLNNYRITVTLTSSAKLDSYT